MSTMNVSLPAAMKKYVRERVKAENYSNASDYIRTLIREDQRRRGIDVLEQLIVEGLNSGEGVVLDDAEWGRIRAEAKRRAKAIARKK
jgi:antitoxin ParD1/3/4